MADKLEGRAAAEWRAHWPVVLAANAGMAVSALPAYASALFLEPFEREFGWSRTEIASVHFMGAVAAITLGPGIGFLADRLGSRRLGIVAVIAMCLAMALLSLTGSNIWTWRALFMGVVVATVLIQPTVWTSAVTGFFSAGRGFALAVALCGTSLCSIITPKLSYELIESFGWRTAFVGLAVIWGAVVLPLVWLFFTSPTDKQRLDRHAAAAPSHPQFWSSFRGEILKLRFLQLALAGFSIALVVVTMATNIVPVLVANDLTRAQAAGIAGLLGLASITGRLTIGFLLDRFTGRYIAAVAVCMPIIGSLILITNPGSLAAASLAVLIFGLSLGAELDVMAYLTSRYFRTENFGLMFGTIGGFITLAGGTGPALLNRVFDVTGSYVPALWAILPLCLVSATLFLLMGPYPLRDQTERVDG